MTNGARDETPVHRTGEHTEEFEWVELICQGDTLAFQDLFMRYHDPLVQFLAHYTGSNVIADEIVVDLFAAIWDKRSAWTIQHGSVKNYLYIAARNRALNVIKRERRRMSLLERVDHGDEIPGMGNAPVDILEHLYTEDAVRALEQAIAALPERVRVAITLRWQQQMSFDDIACILGTSTNAVQMQISRGIKTLRALLETFPR